MADAARPWVRLRFTAPAPGGGRRPIEQLLALAATRAGRGGARLWFVDGGRRVPQLHLPPGGEEFRSG